MVNLELDGIHESAGLPPSSIVLGLQNGLTVKLVLQFLDRRGYTGIRVRVQESLICKRIISMTIYL